MVGEMMVSRYCSSFITIRYPMPVQRPKLISESRRQGRPKIQYNDNKVVGYIKRVGVYPSLSLCRR